jgi:hypothetical protein
MNKIPSAESDNWILAEGSWQGRPTMIRYRPNLAKYIGDIRYPRRITFTWEYEDSHDNGLPTDAQNSEMDTFENSLVATFDPERIAILAFVFTRAGIREWHYYVGHVADLSQRVDAALAYSEERLPIKIAIEDDADWQQMNWVLNQCK